MSSTPNREVALFSAALELPAGERAAYLAEACADDPALRLRLEALLGVHEDAITFLEHKAPGAPESPLAAERPDATVRITPAPSEKPGDRIGRYKLLQQIGEGGCGIVYMAEQEEPVRRRVALKVIKLGMDTKQVIARFEAERQALALMDHPNIAKVLDAGATETGRPYFVMELVRGIKITDYCDANNLSTRQRLGLFVEVCKAIQHAHQKGIIHRDIKPSNILVADHDGVPVPKIIDFGIAKATTDQRLTDKTLFTAFEQFIGTPAYMSPEQAKLSGLDIDTRSDIYSLGVLLYELLTGSTPFDSKALMQAGLDEIRRTILETEPPKPSTRLSHELEAGEVARLKTRGQKSEGGGQPEAGASSRRVQVKELIHLLRGDLDWIVMKALEKDRARRYETANGFASDIQRHLNNEPVVARPPSPGYRFQKLARRNKLAFAAAAAVAVAVLIGLATSTGLLLKESAARRRAVAAENNAHTQAAKATAVSDFLQQMLRSANPDTLKGSDYTVRQLLDDFSAGLGNQLAGQPEVEATVRATIGNAYRRLGVTDKAEPHLERALALRRHTFGEQSEEVAHSLVDHAWNIFEQDRFSEAAAEAQLGLDIYRLRNTDAQPVIRALWTLELSLKAQGRFDEAEVVAGKALAIARNSPGRDFPELASVIHTLAEVKNAQTKYGEAESLALQAVEMHRRLEGAGHPETAWSLLSLGQARRGQHKLEEAEGSFREALTIFNRYYYYKGKGADTALSELMGSMQDRGDFAALEALHRELLAGQRAVLGKDSPAVAETLSRLAGSLKAQGKQAEADEALREALEIALNLRDQDFASLPNLAQGIAAVLSSRGRSQDAEKLFEDAINLTRPKLGETNLIVGELLHDYGNFLMDENKFEAAADYHLKSLVSRRSQPDDNLAWTLRHLGGELVALEKPREAEPYLRESLVLYRKLHEQEDLNCTAWPSERLGEALRQQHKLPEAEQAYREALAAYAKCQAVGSDAYESVVRSLLDVLQAENKPADGEALCREILARQQATMTNGSPALAETLISLADSLYAQDKHAEGEKASRQAMEIFLNLRDQERAEIPASVRRLAKVLKSRGRSLDAERLFEDSIQSARQKLGETNLVLGELLHDYAGFLEGENKWEASAEQYLKSLAIRRANQDDGLAWTLRNLGGCLTLIGRAEEAEGYLRESLALYHKLHRQEWIWGTAWPTERLGYALLQQHKLPEAEQAYRDALASYTKCQALGSDGYAAVVRSLLNVLKEENKLPDAEALCRKILAEQRAAFTNDHQGAAQTLIALVDNLTSQGKQPEAEKMAREAAQECHAAMAHYEKLASDLNRHQESWSFAISYEALGALLKQIGQTQAAEIAYRDTQLLWRKLVADFNTEDHRFHLAVSLEMLGHLLREAGRTDEALGAYRAAQMSWLELVAEFNQEDRRLHLGWTDHYIGQVLKEAGRLDEAAAAYGQALEVRRNLVHDFNKDDYRAHLSGTLLSLAATLQAEGKRGEAEAVQREANVLIPNSSGPTGGDAKHN